MSQRALLLAVRDRLRQSVADGGLGYTARECDVMFDGHPPPSCGEFFAAVWPGAWRGMSQSANYREDTHGVNVTVTVRAAKVPQDRIGTSLLAGPTGQSLTQKLEAIASCLHGDPGPRSATDASHYPVIALANTMIGANANGFVEPLIFQDGGRPEDKYAEWFSADPSGSNPPLGIAQTLSFGGARRTQTIESQT